MTKQVHKIFWSILVILLLSCQKQSVPEIEADFKTAEEQRRLETCSQVDLTNNILDHYNVQLLFKCMRWDKEYPALFESVTKVQRTSWNHLMMPINDSVLKNQNRKDKFFKNIRELDAREGLDDLSFVLTALTETNFFDATKDLFDCVNDPSLQKCEIRKGRIPNKNELKLILDALKIDTKALGYGSNIIKHIIYATKDQKEELRGELLKFITLSDYIKFRLKVVDSLADKGISGLSELDRQFIVKTFLSGSSSGTEPWLYSWLQNDRLTEPSFLYLATYAAKANPKIIDEFKALELLYAQGVNCKNPSGTADYGIDFDLPNHLDKYIGILINKDQSALMNFFAKDIPALNLVMPTCPELSQNKYGTNVIETADAAMKLASVPEYYDLFKFLFSNGKEVEGLAKEFSERAYFLDLVTNPFFENVSNIQKSILETSPSFFPLTYKILKGLEKQVYLDTGRLSEILLLKENEPVLKGFGVLWNFYTEEEKNFLFNFIDRHFQNNTNYILLFDFYSKLLDDSKDIMPELKKSWNSSEESKEESYLALADVLSNLHGDEALKDFRKFLSRDQIIKVLEILSSGIEFNEKAKRDLDYLYADNYVNAIRDEAYSYRISPVGNSANNKNFNELLGCVEEFTAGKTFYELVKNFPEKCNGVEENYFGIKLYRWLSDFDKTYVAQNAVGYYKSSILDSEGLFSPLLLNTNLGVLKIADSLWGQREIHQSGLTYLLDKMSFYLYDFKFHQDKLGIDLAVSLLDWLILFDSEFSKELEFFRSSVLKEWTDTNNFKLSHVYMVNSTDLLKKYANWLKSGQYTKSKFKSYPPMRDEFTCEKFVNTQSGPSNCPNKEQVKFYATSVVKSLSTVWEKEQGSPIAHLIRSVKNGGGVNIPFESKNPKRYYITLREAIESVYDMSDKSLPINRMPVNLVNERNQRINPVLTTMERIENVIREVRFGYNYIGVAYLNYVVAAEDYSDEVKSRKALYSACVKVPSVRCGRRMSDEDLRMAKNSLETYDGLLDANNGRGLEPKLKYGNFLSAFQQALVASSVKKAQERQLLPINEEHLKKHNGKILGDLSMVAAYSNLGRYLRDRIAPTRKDLTAFLNRRDVKMVDEALLRGFNIEKVIPVAERLLSKTLVKNSKDKKSLVELTVDWMAGLNYQDSRRVEETIAKLVVIGSYLGTPKDVFGESFQNADIVEMNERYKNNNLYDLFITLERLIDYWPKIEKAFPKDTTLVSFFREISPMVDFLHGELMNSSSAKNDKAFRFVNDTYIIMRELMFEKREQLNYKFAVTGITGVDLIIGLLNKEILLNKFIQNLREQASFLATFQSENGDARVKTLADDLSLLLNNSKLKGEGYRLYFENTSRPVNCRYDSSICQFNYHYDEPMKLIRYLGAKNQNNRPRILDISNTIFKEERVNIDSFIQDAFDAIILD